MQRKSLAVASQLGGLECIANAHGNLGSIFKQREHIIGARKHLTRALELYTQIGMPHRIEEVQALLDELPPAD